MDTVSNFPGSASNYDLSGIQDELLKNQLSLWTAQANAALTNWAQGDTFTPVLTQVFGTAGTDAAQWSAAADTLRTQLLGDGLGIKIQLSGRLGGAEMSRTLDLRLGKIPLSTLQANVDYAVTHAFTTSGALGVKVRPNGIPKDVPEEKTIAQIGASLRECGHAPVGDRQHQHAAGAAAAAARRCTPRASTWWTATSPSTSPP